MKKYLVVMTNTVIFVSLNNSINHKDNEDHIQFPQRSIPKGIQDSS